MSFKNENIWIIGASSGIGAALAKELSNEGATLILSARREEELETLNKELGGEHYIYLLDVADSDHVKHTAETIKENLGKLDRVLFMAAIYRPGDIEEHDVTFAKQLVEVNLLGAIYTTYATLPIFNAQKSGQIVLCGSVAGYTGLPGGQPYSATKAAIINFAESLHAEVQSYIDVKMINPGFVRTRITDKNKFHMPMRIEPEDAAKAIAHGLKHKSFEIHFPKRFTYLVKILHAMPYAIKLFLTRKMRDKS